MRENRVKCLNSCWRATLIRLRWPRCLWSCSCTGCSKYTILPGPFGARPCAGFLKSTCTYWTPLLTLQRVWPRTWTSCCSTWTTQGTCGRWTSPGPSSTCAQGCGKRSGTRVGFPFRVAPASGTGSSSGRSACTAYRPGSFIGTEIRFTWSIGSWVGATTSSTPSFTADREWSIVTSRCWWVSYWPSTPRRVPAIRRRPGWSLSARWKSTTGCRRTWYPVPTCATETDNNCSSTITSPQNTPKTFRVPSSIPLTAASSSRPATRLHCFETVLRSTTTTTQRTVLGPDDDDVSRETLLIGFL